MKGAGITDAVLEEIKARIDLADLISSYGIQVKVAGASKKACCPFHHEKTPSFNINETKGFYHCFGCGESGDAIKFVQKMDGLSFVEAVKKLAEQCGVKIEERDDPTAGRRRRLWALTAELAQFYHRCLLKTKEAEQARAYLASRDLSPDVQEAFLIGYAPNGIATILKWAEKYGYSADELAEAGVIKPPRDPRDRGYHRFGGRLMFTIRDKQGRAVAFSGRQLVASKNSGKYVNSPETPIFKKSNVLFGFDKAAGNIAKSPHHEALVCEGQIDTIRLHISGFPVAVASQGTAFTEEHVKLLKKVADQVVLVFDDDDAGHKATIRTAGLFLAAGMPVRVVSLPGGDDPDSFLRTHPKEDFQRLLDNAESIMSFQVRVERSKERNPDSVDAMARITKAVLATVVQADSAVIRASMLGEISKLLRLPVVALEQELARAPAAHAQVGRPPRDLPDSARPTEFEEDEVGEEDFSDVDDGAPLEGAPAGAAAPPPSLELCLCQFLIAHEYDKKLDATVGEFLPVGVFANGFTARFVETWRAEIATGSDKMGEFADALPPAERAWFEKILTESGKDNASTQSASKILEDYVRAIWESALRRMRGNLPAQGSPEDAEKILRLTISIPQLRMAKWSRAKEIIREWL